MSSSPVKNEFVEILTAPELIPSSLSTATEEFPTVLTESSLLETNPPANPTMSYNALIKRYDETFVSQTQYKEFLHDKLSSWNDTFECRLFDSLYVNHRNTTNTIKDLRKQAMILLEGANRLQDQNHVQRRDLDRLISELPPSRFKRTLFNPVKTHPKPPRPPMRQRNPSPPPRASSSRRTIIRCFQCDSPNHIKWYCNDYRCKFCKKIAPGHSQRDCPANQPTYYDDGQRGHYDLYGDEDGNLRGEC